MGRYTGRKVVVIERSRYEHPRIGETVSAALGPLLAYLGVDGLLNSKDHMPAYGTEAAWGLDQVLARDFLFTGRGIGWHLDRLAFDRGLADAAARGGADLRQGLSVREAVRDGDIWRLRAGSTDIVARQVIDATGRGAAFARLTGARRHRLDRTVGVGIRMELQPGRTVAQNVLIEATREGWWYSAPIPRHLLVVVFMTDADLLTRSAIEPASWEAALAQASKTVARCREARRLHTPRVWPASSDVLAPPLGDGWVAAGDAAISFDPLSSLGIGHAIASGIQAARIAEDRLNGGETLSAAYTADLTRHRDVYLSQRQHLYATEMRFADASFWRRRRASCRGP